MNTMLSLAWRNLWRHRKRTWLTIGAMVFSNILLVFMITLQLGNYDMMIENSLKAYSGQLQIASKGYNQEPKMRLTIDDIVGTANELRSVAPTLTISSRAETFVMASSEQRSFGLQIAGVEVAFEASVSSIPGLISEGQYLRSGDFPEIILGKVLARNLKVSVGDEVTLLGSGYDGSFAAVVLEVRGIFESGLADLDRNLAQISLTSFQALFSMGKRGHVIVANGPEITKVDTYQKNIRSVLNQPQAKLEILNWKELNPGLQQAILSDMASAWFMYAVLIVLVSFSVLNTQLMSVLERTREFGIMTAIGLRPSALARLVLLETSAMAGMGLLIGTIFGLALALYLKQVGFSIPGMDDMAAQYNLPARMHPAISLVSIMSGPMAVFIGCLLAAVYPVIRLQSLQPVAAMRAA
ncbi:MAG: putative ABC transport system permease protein [Arenicella sp.]|jgi:putative ABC transport system permease protein